MAAGRTAVGRSAAGRSTASRSPARSTALVNTRTPLTVSPVSVRFRRAMRAVERPSSPFSRLLTVRPACSGFTSSSTPVASPR